MRYFIFTAEKSLRNEQYLYVGNEYRKCQMTEMRDD